MNTIKTYKPNAQFKLITFEMIDKIIALKIPKNEKFKFCRPSLSQAIINPLKVSYIKKEKIRSLKEHANISLPLSPTPEQRNKYFSACSLEKFANHIFNKETITTEQLTAFNDIVKNAKMRANATLTKELQTFKACDIPNIYHINNGSDKTINFSKVCNQFQDLHISEKNDINKSCMQGKPKKWFEIYTDIEESQAVEMATLIQGNEIVARALVWFDVPADKVGTDVIQPRDVYIDRIYTKTQEHRAETQTQLFFDILKHYKIETEEKIISAPIPLQVLSKMNDKNKELGKTKTKIILPNCYNRNDIFEKVKARLNTTKEIKLNSYCVFDVETNSDYYSYWPYLDSLQWFDTYNQKLISNEEHGSDILKLDSTSGAASNTHKCCDNCGQEIYNDEERWVETEDMYVCEDCAVYCDERDEWILERDAIYNNHSGQYHYNGDLDI